MVALPLLETEISAFDAMLPKLRQERGAVWAVVVDSRLQATFADFEDAADFAVSTFGERDYLIRHTQEHTAHIPFIAVEA